MDQTSTIVFVLVGFIVQLIILRWIISTAITPVLSKIIGKEQRRQTLLLAKMAQKQGVSDEEVNKIINL
ncbi:hypothetical protein BH10BAC3_BH10BAC3_06150 [soil metagenome]